MRTVQFETNEGNKIYAALNLLVIHNMKKELKKSCQKSYKLLIKRNFHFGNFEIVEKMVPYLLVRFGNRSFLQDLILQDVGYTPQDVVR